MDHKIIAFAIPVFVAMMGVELWHDRRKNGTLYRFNDAVTNLSCGISSQTTGMVVAGFAFLVYSFTWAHFRIFDLDSTSVATWVFAFFAYDFIYYWWHRFTHSVNIGWATHVVHHQSEEYNLAVALRQSITSPIFHLVFNIPLAFLGVDPLVYAIISAISLLYQFWIHTEAIGKLGAFELVFNTPSHHRVHHATNPQYLDRNHAAILIIWDRMFGTFEEEIEEPVYGTVKPLESFNPLYANWWYFGLLLVDHRASTTSADRLKVWFGPPGFRPAGLAPYPAAQPVQRATQNKYNPTTPGGLNLYIGLHFLTVIGAMTALLYLSGDLPTLHVAASGIWVVWGCLNFGGLFERRSWTLPSEGARLVSTIAVAAIVAPLSMMGVAVGVVLSLGWLFTWRDWMASA
ncbi:MAG: sterol desaturase family protein [Rhodobacterales bacterium]|nr:sterol desaturase family protein [Rhodobacterales bacterium]